MRIQIVCPHFEPDVAPTGVVISEIVRGFVSRGHEVDVVTSLPWYSARTKWTRLGRVGLISKEKTAWGSITRVYPFPNQQAQHLGAGVGFRWIHRVGWSLFAISRENALRCDCGDVAAAHAWLGCLVDVAVAASTFRVQRPGRFPRCRRGGWGDFEPWRDPTCSRCLERFVYRRADFVTVLSEDLRGNVEAKIHPPQKPTSGAATKVRVIPNFVDTKRIRPQVRDNSYRSEFGLGSSNCRHVCGESWVLSAS